MKIFRVVVRGQFSDLDEAQQSRLLDEAPEHHFHRSAFTAAGTLTYDEQLVAFNFRYEVRHGEPGPEPDEIGAAAVARALATLEADGITAKHVRVSVTDMATMWS